MIQQVESRRDEISALCREFHVARLELFGSAVTSEFDPGRSDLDFLVSFALHPDLTSFEQYFGFKEALEATFDRSVDLVMERALRNPYFISSVDRTRQLLYAA